MSDWLNHLTPAERRRVERRRWWLRLRERLGRRSSRVGLLLVIYLLACLSLWLWGGRDIGLLALLPLLFTPLLAFLAYWLVWSEFHR